MLRGFWGEMINSNLLTDELAEGMAKQILVHNIKEEIVASPFLQF